MRWSPLLLVLLLPGSAQADPLYPWGAHSGPVIGVNPYLEVDAEGWVSPYGYLMTGPEESWDLLAGGGVDIAPGGGIEGGFAEAFVRWFPATDTALAARLGWDAEIGLYLGPEVHSVAWAGPFAWWTNLGLLAAPQEAFSAGLVATLAPELWIGPASVFLQVDPEIWWTPGEGFEGTTWIAPGLSLWWGPEEQTGVTLAVRLPVLDPDGTPAVAASFYFDAPLRRPARRP